MAISADGLPPFVKHPRPVIEHFPQPSHSNAEEEGIYSCAAEVVGSTVWLWYGAIRATGPHTVDVDIRVTQSVDGIRFTDDRKLPGVDTTAGELWPFSVVHINGRYYLLAGRRDRVDWLAGDDPYTLGGQRPSGLLPREDRELGVSLEDLGGNRFGVMYDDPVRVATARVGSPTIWTGVGTYRMPEGEQGKTWFRDDEQWLRYSLRLDGRAVRVWSAPITPAD